MTNYPFKKIILGLTLFFQIHLTYSQGVEWAVPGLTNQDALNATAINSNGDLFFSYTEVDNQYISDSIPVKLKAYSGSDGKVLWEKKIGNASSDNFPSLQILTNNAGDIYVLQRRDSLVYGPTDTFSIILDRYSIRKFDKSNGNLLQSKVLNMNATLFRFDNEDNLLVADYFPDPYVGVTLKKLDSRNFEKIWEIKFNSGYVGLSGGFFDKNNNGVFALFFRKAIQFNGQTIKESQLVSTILFKVDESGNILYWKGLPNIDYIIGVDPKGNCYMYITYPKNAVFETGVQDVTMNADCWGALLKVDVETGLIKTAGCFSTDPMTPMPIVNSEGLLFYFERAMSINTNFGRIINLNRENIQRNWSRDVRANINEIFSDKSGNLYLSGTYSEFVRFDNITLTTTDSNSGYIVKLKTKELGIANIEAETELQVFPNPFENELRIYINKEDLKPYTISLIDPLGKIHGRWSGTHITEQIFGAGLQDGLYFLVIEEEGSKKIVKRVYKK